MPKPARSPVFQSSRKFLASSNKRKNGHSHLETTWTKVFPTVMPKSAVLNEADTSYDWRLDPEIEQIILVDVFEMGISFHNLNR